MKHAIHMEGGRSLSDLLDTETFRNASVTDTLNGNGVMVALHSARHVVDTMTLSGYDSDTIAYAFEKPWKYPEFWLPALYIHGVLYRVGGHRLYTAFISDVEYDDNHTFTIKELEPTE
jgi:hypothetical protein